MNSIIHGDELSDNFWVFNCITLTVFLSSRMFVVTDVEKVCLHTMYAYICLYDFFYNTLLCFGPLKKTYFSQCLLALFCSMYIFLSDLLIES